MSSPFPQADVARAPALELKLAHSPDSDDAFMFYGLATQKVRSGNLKFTHALEDIETLNQKAQDSVYDVTAISFHAYAYLAQRYVLLPSGASFGERYGPIVIARGHFGREGLKKKRLAIPGKWTTAYLVLQMYEREIEPVFVAFDRILETVLQGAADAGVVIHEGQLTYGREGLRKIVDLGEWWNEQTGLPLPLGGNAVRRTLEPQTVREISRLLKRSIQYGLDHREQALEYALQFARGLDAPTVDHFISMYVNERTLDYGARGRQAVQTLLDRGYDGGLLPQRVQAEFAE